MSDTSHVAQPLAAIPLLPYATPPNIAQGVWRSGTLLVVGHEATLPHRCLICNAQPDRRVSWQFDSRPTPDHPNKRSAPLQFSLCQSHATELRDQPYLRAFALLAYVAIYFYLYAIALASPKLVWPSLEGWTILVFLLLIGGIVEVVLHRRLPPFRVIRQTESAIWLRGRWGVYFLYSFPKLPSISTLYPRPSIARLVGAAIHSLFSWIGVGLP